MMSRYYTFIIFLLPAVVAYQGSLAQGCSDAGFCSLNSLKPQTEETTQQAKIGVTMGRGDHSIMIFSPYVAYSRKINDKIGIDVKFTMLGQNGNDISTFQVSDLYLNGTYAISERIKGILGFKLPLQSGNVTYMNRSLPMDYQSSLGTTDLIVGLALALKRLHLVAALQQPLTQNKNGFLAEDPSWSNTPISRIQSTNKFKRAADALLRCSYKIPLNDRLTFTPGLLSIFHLQEDKYTSIGGLERTIDDSNGITLNVLFFLDYKISDKHALQLNAGSPAVARKARPDGLTRSVVASLEYRMKF